jgi:hypothetical protein
VNPCLSGEFGSLLTIFCVLKRDGQHRLAHVFLAETTIHPPIIVEFGPSSVVMAVPPIFRASFVRSMATVLDSGRRAILLWRSIQQTMQFMLEPLKFHSAVVDIDGRGSATVEFSVPIARIAPCRSFTALASDPGLVLFEWQHPD